MDPDIQALVNACTERMLPTLPDNPLPLSERLLAALWPYLERVDNTDTPEPYPEPRDKRVKPWQIAIHFWIETPTGPELVASTDPEVVHSTGAISDLVPQYALELHEGGLPDPLRSSEIKPRLRQLRNNLARQGGTALRIPYVFEGQDYLCQVDVMRLVSAP